MQMNDAPIKPTKHVYLVGVDDSVESVLAAERAFALATGATDQVVLLSVTAKGAPGSTLHMDKIQPPETFKGHLERRCEGATLDFSAKCFKRATQWEILATCCAPRPRRWGQTILWWAAAAWGPSRVRCWAVSRNTFCGTPTAQSLLSVNKHS